MKKSVIFAAITTAIGMASTTISFADETAPAMDATATPPQMEKCQVNRDGKSYILEHKADCQTSSTHSCMGNNTANDSESWIFVPQGECAKIKACDFSGLNDSDKAKLDMNALNQSCGMQSNSSTTDGTSTTGTQSGTTGTQSGTTGTQSGTTGTQSGTTGGTSSTVDQMPQPIPTNNQPKSVSQ